MKKTITNYIAIIIIIANCLIPSQTRAQGQLTGFMDWSTNTGTQNTYVIARVLTDPISGNITTVGTTYNTNGTTDIIATQTDNMGNLIFTTSIDGPSSGNDAATSAILDSTNIIIVGFETDTVAKMAIIKINSSGGIVWTTLYSCVSALYGSCADITVDNNHDFYCTGGIATIATGGFFQTLKVLNSGSLQWQHSYDYNVGEDFGVQIVTDNTTAYTAGISQAGVNDYRITVISLACSSGSQNSVSVSSTTSSTKADLVTSARLYNNYVYIAGAQKNTNFDGYCEKFNSSLVSQWYEVFDSGDDDIWNSIDVDNSGNVTVAGSLVLSGYGKNAVMINYDSSGAQQWMQTDSLAGDDEYTCVRYDNSQANLVACGYKGTNINKEDYLVRKYSNAGSFIWEAGFDGMAHGSDKAIDLLADVYNNFIVVGESETDSAKYELRTVFYKEYDVVNPTDLHNEGPSQAFNYFENRGQLVSEDTSHSKVMEERFYTNYTNPKLYFTNNSYSMVFAHVDTIAATADTLHRIDVTFPGSASMDVAKIYPMEEQPFYLSYFLTDCPDGITEVHGNQKLIIPDLYSGIDLIYYSNNAGFKYYFVVKPGAHATDIEEFFDGASSTVLNSTSHVLTVNSSIGSVSFQRPKAYNLNSSNVVVPLTDSIFDWDSVGVDTYAFDIGTYDNTKPLIIEVMQRSAKSVTATYKNIIWSTYMGGELDDEFDKVVTKRVGVYVAGRSISVGFPTVAGNYMPGNILGARLATAVKFNKKGVRLYATYYGNNTNTNVNIGDVSGAVDSKRCFYLTGHVGSTTSAGILFPTTQPPGAYVNNVYTAGHEVVFVAKIDSSFIHLKWATYYNGSLGRTFLAGYPELNIDAVDNIYLTYSGDSTSPLLHAPGAYFDSLNGGSTIVKFDSTMHRKWATRFGSLYTQIESGTFDPAGNFYVSGHSGQPFPSPFPFVTPGFPAYQDTTYGSLSGGVDICVAKFDKTTNALIWSSLYGGAGNSLAHAMACDDGGNIYITGNTFDNFPCHYAGAGSFIDSTFNTGGNHYDAFMLKFGPSLDLKWSSLWGENDADAGWGVACDPITRNVYFTGMTYSSNDSLWGNSSYYQQSYGGDGEAYVLGFTSSLVPICASYFGYAGNDQGLSIATNAYNQLYMVGFTNSHQNSHFLNENPQGGAWFVDTLTGGYDGHITSFVIDTANHTGIAEHIIYSDGLTIYPNPTNGYFNYVLKTDDKNAQLKVYNILGELVLLNKLSSGNGMYKGTIDLTEYQNGIYFVIAEASNKLITQKIMKQ